MCIFTLRENILNPCIFCLFDTTLGEKATFDVFLSYRVASDYKHCAALYEVLTNSGLTVWWDKMCLKPGEPWEEGFCSVQYDRYLFVLYNVSYIIHA